jgi:hypothetical protein
LAWRDEGVGDEEQLGLNFELRRANKQVGIR